MLRRGSAEHSTGPLTCSFAVIHILPDVADSRAASCWLRTYSRLGGTNAAVRSRAAGGPFVRDASAPATTTGPRTWSCGPGISQGLTRHRPCRLGQGDSGSLRRPVPCPWRGSRRGRCATLRLRPTREIGAASASVAQRIEHRPPEPGAWVRVPPGAPLPDQYLCLTHPHVGRSRPLLVASLA
jgi:hypothetical protein